MATTTTVTPGDLITAELMNEILARLAALEGGGGSAGLLVTVPTVIGKTISEARAILLAPAQQVALGTVTDVNGKTVNSALPSSGTRKVVSQSPGPGLKVSPNTAIFLLVTADPSAPAASPPAINGLSKTKVAVGQPLRIDGTSFAVPSSDNLVTFDGKQASIGSGSNSKELFVTVPTGIPNAPVQAGDPDRAGVKIVVSTVAGGASNAFPVTISAPISNAPKIDTITPDVALVLETMVINGSGFNPTAAKNKVTIDGVQAPVVSAQPTRLDVTVPDGIAGLLSKNDFRVGVPVAVTNQDVSNAEAKLDHKFFRNRD